MFKFTISRKIWGVGGVGDVGGVGGVSGAGVGATVGGAGLGPPRTQHVS